MPLSFSLLHFSDKNSKKKSLEVINQLITFLFLFKFKMWYKLIVICLIIEFSTFASIVDYINCQKRFNCSENLQLSDCPKGKYLDVNMGKGKCCHQCRSGIGNVYAKHNSIIFFDDKVSH